MLPLSNGFMIANEHTDRKKRRHDAEEEEEERTEGVEVFPMVTGPSVPGELIG